MAKEVKQYDDGCLMMFVIIILVVTLSVYELVGVVDKKLDRIEKKLEQIQNDQSNSHSRQP